MERTFFAAGNFLSLFKKKNRLRFITDPLGKPDPKSVFGEVNKEIFDRFGDEATMTKVFKENLDKANKELAEKINPTLKKIQEGITLTPEEEIGFQMFVDKMGRTNGDITQLKELDLTADAVLARLQTQQPLSTMMAPLNLPIQGLADMNFQLFSRMMMMAGDSQIRRWPLKDDIGSKASWKEFEWARDTMLNIRFTANQALKDSYYRFITGKAISDQGDLANKAYKLSQGGVVREQAVLDDLKQQWIKLPIVNWVLNRGLMNKKAFDILNYLRVGAKVFHDYAIPGEAHQYRSWVGRNIFGAQATAIGKVTGLGTKSYYPNGPEVNMTLWGNLFASGDEMSSSM